ncbi:hypothetical protein, partial [Microvirga tunisiensis]|uniref:hypothetical protein n=1 Tax=Microvirga tunisiensis TaxID=2108360 RepID=UPI001AED97A1
RNPSWPAFMCERNNTGRTYERKRSDQTMSKSSCEAGAVHIWHIRAFPPAGALLAFYHPKFGPVGFTLPTDQIARIVSFLTDRFILQPTQSAEKH